MLKKILIFVLCLAPWFLTNIVPVDYSYFDTIKLPFFCPPKAAFGIIWTILYIFIAISIYGIVTNYKLKEIPKSYKTALLLNYIFNQAYTLIFFGLKNNFLAFVDTVAIFISFLFLYHETNNLREKSSKFLDPYVLFSLFASILALTIYVINTL